MHFTCRPSSFYPHLAAGLLDPDACNEPLKNLKYWTTSAITIL